MNSMKLLWNKIEPVYCLVSISKVEIIDSWQKLFKDIQVARTIIHLDCSWTLWPYFPEWSQIHSCF